jgi:aminoglycoside/choline kinase family phosphotransferase
MPDRTAERAAFLAAHGWADAAPTPLAGDASARRYWRLARGTARAILMDNPPGIADDPVAFANIANHLAGMGLSPPRIFAADLPRGLLLIEDLGDAVYDRVIAEDPALERPLYEVATDTLAHLAAHPAPPGLPDLTAQEWAQAAALVADGLPGQAPDRDGLVDALTAAMLEHADGPRVLILRDFHAQNLIWLPDRQGLARAGLLDFQLAQMGQPGYDLVSLVQDARRDVSPETAAAMMRRYADAMGLTSPEARFAVLGTQRALRILGVFARLAAEQGKRQYLALVPRVQAQLQACLAHPALRHVAPLLRNLPDAPPCHPPA